MSNKARPSSAARFLTAVLVLNLMSYSALWAQRAVVIKEKGDPLVNQAGYNTGEAKRLVAPGAPDGTPFKLLRVKTSAGATTDADDVLYTGTVKNYVGDFTSFNPVGDAGEYVVEVDGHGRSVPFRIADHLMERLSSRLAYQFFIDVRGSTDPLDWKEARTAGGGPSRDGGAYTLEAVYETLFYASNPALFDRWTDEMEPRDGPDLIDLILWHGRFAYEHLDYNGVTGHRPYLIGHRGQKLQTYDYQNTLDYLAAICAAYHPFLKTRLDEATYQRYRQACLDRWEQYERDREVRFWVKSEKWIDVGWTEFNEMGNALGQGLLRNLLMYLAERNEPAGQPEKFLKYAQNCAEDVIKNWYFEDPRHTWLARNAEHITPQALALFLMVAPDKAPAGTREKLAAWRDYVSQRTDNLWHYRTHDDREWANPRSKEVGTVAGLGGAMFAVSHVLDDRRLRELGWSQVNFVFGLNPVNAHLSHKNKERLARGGYWEGVENGWPHLFLNGAGNLDGVRGTLDGSPLNNAFPYNPKGASGESYSTEGWAVTNRAWMSTVTFSTLGSHQLRLKNPTTGEQIASAGIGDAVKVELKAALNLDPKKVETGYVNVALDNGPSKQRLTVTETGPDTGIFTGACKAADFVRGVASDNRRQTAPRKMTMSYGYLGFEKTASLGLTKSDLEE